MTARYNGVVAAVERIEYDMATTAIRYVNEFLALTCAPDYLASGVLPRGAPAKEPTEVMGMYSAVRRVHPADFSDPGVVMLDVGCGSAPRGAALFALRSAWKCIGIDPRVTRGAGSIRRVSWAASTVEDYIRRNDVQEMLASASAVVAVNTHGHAPLDYLLDVPNKRTWCFAMPCCIPLAAPDGFVEVSRRTDPAVCSPKNEIAVWRRQV